MVSLRELADSLLELGRQRAIRGNGMEGQNLPSSNQNSEAELLEYSNLYDELLWAILTSPIEELVAFSNLLFEDSYINLPAPLQVTALRLVGLEIPDNAEILRRVNGRISFFCSPDEEENATRAIKARLNAL